MLLWAAALPAIAGGGMADDKGKAEEDERIKALVMFVLDVELYKGMFYGQYDYCAPKVPALIAKQALTAWQNDNAPYLAAQADAERQYILAMKARGGTEEWARQTIGDLKKKNYDRMHEDRKYINAKIEPQEDKGLACSSHLGSLVSYSMTFQRISPEGYKYWQAHYAP
jgi:hypothetical protein